MCLSKCFMNEVFEAMYLFVMSFGVSPVNYSDSDSDSNLHRRFRMVGQNQGYPKMHQGVIFSSFQCIL